MFTIAECQIELGQLIEARNSINKLLNLETDAGIQFNAKRIKANLEKGYTTLDQIYNH